MGPWERSWKAVQLVAREAAPMSKSPISLDTELAEVPRLRLLLMGCGSAWTWLSVASYVDGDVRPFGAADTYGLLCGLGFCPFPSHEIPARPPLSAHQQRGQRFSSRSSRYGLDSDHGTSASAGIQAEWGLRDASNGSRSRGPLHQPKFSHDQSGSHAADLQANRGAGPGANNKIVLGLWVAVNTLCPRPGRG